MSIKHFKQLKGGIIMNAMRFYSPWVERSLLDDLFNRMVINDTQDQSACGCVPANIMENENDFSIELAVPGFTKEEIKINIQKNVLIIKAERNENTEDKVKYIRKEFGKKPFARKFIIPKNVDTDHVSAAFNNGILEVHIPKKEEVLEKAPVEIEIV
jgi:HSP20 family protein